MASNSPPPQLQKGDLWDTDPNTFVAREAVKRLDLTECHLTDDAIMRLLVNKRERTISGVNISRFNEYEFVKGGFLRSRHKGKGAAALAPDGTVMTVTAGAHHNSIIVLHGGNHNLPPGSWSVENYQAKSDHPGYKEWLSKIKWTNADALRAGIPLTSINATLTNPPRRAQQNTSEPKENKDALRAKKEDSPPSALNKAEGLTNEGQLNNTADFKNQGQEPITATPPVATEEAPLEETPSEYATLSSTYSEITISNPTTPEPSRPKADPSEIATSELTAYEPATSKPATFKPVVAEPATLEPVVSQSATSDLAVSEPATSEPTIPEPVSSEPASSDLATSRPATSEPIAPEPVTSEPVTSDLTASQSVTSEPTTLDSATSKPIASGPAASEFTILEPATLEVSASKPAASQPVASEPPASGFTISDSATLEASASKPVATEPTISEPAASNPVTSELVVLKPAFSEPAVSKPAPLSSTSIQAKINPPEASEPAISKPAPLEYSSSISIQAKVDPLEAANPNIMQSQASASVRQQSAEPGPASIGLTPDMKFEAKISTVGSELTVGLGIDTGLKEQTTPKHSASMFHQQFIPRQPSLEIRETPPPSTHYTVHSEAQIPRERTPTISPEASRMKHNHATMSTEKHSLRYPPTTQPASTTNQTNSFQSPPPTPASNGSLKRKATEPLDQLVTFYVGEGKPEDMETYNFSKNKLAENAPEFYEQLKGTSRRVKNINGPVYDIAWKPKLFEAMLHWIDKRKVMPKSYFAPYDLEGYYLDLYLAAVNYVMPGLSNAIVDKLYDWHSTGTVQFQMIDKVYSMTQPGDGLRRFYFGCMMALSVEDFEGTSIGEPDVMVDLFAEKKATWGGMEVKEAYHDA